MSTIKPRVSVEANIALDESERFDFKAAFSSWNLRAVRITVDSEGIDSLYAYRVLKDGRLGDQGTEVNRYVLPKDIPAPLLRLVERLAWRCAEQQTAAITALSEVIEP